MIRTVAFTALSAFALAACDANTVGGPAPISPKGEIVENRPTGGQLQPQRRIPVPNPPEAAAAAFARSFLDELQRVSIRDQREYCGYFIVNPDGSFAASPAVRGTFASCDYSIPDDPRIFASYHTHGSFSIAYDNEVPSVADLESDFDFGMDGYISTPGGRIWHVDYATRTARQVCGLGCVYRDPIWRPVEEGNVAQVYTVNSLMARN